MCFTELNQIRILHICQPTSKEVGRPRLVLVPELDQGGVVSLACLQRLQHAHGVVIELEVGVQFGDVELVPLRNLSFSVWTEVGGCKICNK